MKGTLYNRLMLDVLLTVLTEITHAWRWNDHAILWVIKCASLSLIFLHVYIPVMYACFVNMFVVPCPPPGWKSWWRHWFITLCKGQCCLCGRWAIRLLFTWWWRTCRLKRLATLLRRLTRPWADVVRSHYEVWRSRRVEFRMTLEDRVTIAAKVEYYHNSRLRWKRGVWRQSLIASNRRRSTNNDE